MEHVYTCKQLQSEEPLTEYKYIYSENIEKINYVYKRFVENMDIREQILNENENKLNQNEKKKENHEIQSSDPLYPVIVYSNG